ncbi:MAG TPA: hypothetical protein VMV74_02175, partial [Bacteroidales bacterium]|nr:hypothetical protein [Bacteroidales bacterium]
AGGLKLGHAVQRQNIGFHIVTATPSEEAKTVTAGFNTLFADETILKTVIRANPGFLLLHNGTVMAMWSHRGVPSAGEFKGDLNALSVKSHTRKISRLLLICSFLIISVIYLVTKLSGSDNNEVQKTKTKSIKP